MRLSESEIRLILGAIDTLQCELTEQNELDEDARHEDEIKQLDRLGSKLQTELNKRNEKAKCET